MSNGRLIQNLSKQVDALRDELAKTQHERDIAQSRCRELEKLTDRSEIAHLEEDIRHRRSAFRLWLFVPGVLVIAVAMIAFVVAPAESTWAIVTGLMMGASFVAMSWIFRPKISEESL